MRRHPIANTPEEAVPCVRAEWNRWSKAVAVKGINLDQSMAAPVDGGI